MKRPASMLLVLLLAACTGKKPVMPAVPSADEALLTAAMSRPVPAALRSRFHFRIESPMFDGGTGGALIVDRPGNGHLAVMGPLGPIVTLNTDGAGLSVTNRRDKSHLVADDAEGALRAATDGLAGVDEVLGLLVGQVPLEGLEVVERSRTEGGDLRLQLSGPQDIRVDLVLDDPLATPIQLVVTDRAGALLVSAEYGAFEAHDDAPDTYLPSEVLVEMKPFGVSLDVRFKRWDLLGAEVPPVFDLSAPEGFTPGRLEVVVLPGAQSPPR